MDCPRCRHTLAVHTPGSVTVNECPACKGTWLDWDELRMLKDSTDPDLRWMDFQIWKHLNRFQIKEIPLQCPNCSGGMVVIDYDTTTVRVDFCLQCQGVWLDADEFQKIIEELSRELTAKTVSEYLRASLKEARIEMHVHPVETPPRPMVGISMYPCSHRHPALTLERKFEGS